MPFLPDWPGRRAGDGFLFCACGERHWGLLGAAGLLLHHQRAVLLQRRADWSHQGGTWSVPGGALDTGESPLVGALREAAEEAGVQRSLVSPEVALTIDHGTWSYTTVLARAGERLDARAADAESAELRWVAVEEVEELRLHHGFADAWPTLTPLLARRTTIVVDAANVVGSRPDGWWRDRVGAARRLLAGLAPLAETGVALPAADAPRISGPGSASLRVWPDLVVVLEGVARGAAADLVPGVRLVSAAGSGDDAIVAEVRQLQQADPSSDLLVVTSDRGLRQRVQVLGARTIGSGWLLRAIDDSG